MHANFCKTPSLIPSLLKAFFTMNLSRLILALLSTLLFTLLHPPSVCAAGSWYHPCGSTGNYTANSTYEFNLQTLLAKLTTGAANSTNFGFAKSAIGSLPDEVFGLALCRGDVNRSDCYSCLSQATQDIQDICSYYKEAAIYYDFCLLQYANENFLSSTENFNPFYLTNPKNITGSQTMFDSYVHYLINATADFASFNSSKKFATTLMNQSREFPKIYGMAQCTPDMSDSDCASCLNGLIGQMPTLFSGRQGGRIIGTRCSIRYEIYSFTVTSGAPSLLLTPPPDPALSSPAPAPALTPPALAPALTSPLTNQDYEGMK